MIVTVDVLARIDSALADAESQQPEWRAEPEGADGYVTWSGSDDAASTEADDDLDQLAACYVCGWDQDDSDGLAHDAWAEENSQAGPHAYVPGPQETGEVIVSLTGAYEVDGVARCPGGSTDDPDKPQWGLYAYYRRTQDDEEGFLDLITDGLTAQAAVSLASTLGYGWPVGV